MAEEDNWTILVGIAVMDDEVTIEREETFRIKVGSPSDYVTSSF